MASGAPFIYVVASGGLQPIPEDAYPARHPGGSEKLSKEDMVYFRINTIDFDLCEPFSVIVASTISASPKSKLPNNLQSVPVKRDSRLTVVPDLPHWQ